MKARTKCDVIAHAARPPDADSFSLKMSIQRRLAISFTFVLALSLAIGLGLTYGHVSSKVRTEMQAALAVGADAARNALDDFVPPGDAEHALRNVVADFDGDRHVQAVLTAPDGAVLARSRLLPPDPKAPPWFVRLVGTHEAERPIALPPALARVGTLTLRPDPRNELAEAWSDTVLTLTIMAVFFVMVLALAFATIRAALAPIRDIGAALERVGAGDYSARLAPPVAEELEPLRAGFNGMARRLEDMNLQNRALNEQMVSLQEEERAELARDLHDEVAPFLFAVGADTTMVRQFLAKGGDPAQALAAIGPRADSIAEAVKHMQHHLKHVLRRLAPSALLDLGLAGAIDNLVAFWRARRPGIAFEIEVGGDPLDPPLDAIAFRVVQESVSNAIRHGAPRKIEITVDVDAAQATIVVEDDGGGFPGGAPSFGFGLTGMQERVRAVGGTIRIRNRPTGHGASVEARLPIRRRSDADVPEAMEHTA